MDGSDVLAVFKEVSGERVTKCVGGDTFWYAGQSGGLFDGFLEDGLVEVVASPLAAFSVEVGSGGGEDPLPTPVAGGVWRLACEGMRHFYVAGSDSEVFFMLSSDEL